VNRNTTDTRYTSNALVTYEYRLKNEATVKYGPWASSTYLNPALRVRIVELSKIVRTERFVVLFSADSVQAGWAYTNDVNLIAAGYNAPRMSGGGSGIYAGRDGPLVMFMPDRAGTQIVISRVLKRNYNNGCGGRSKRCSVDSSYLTFMSDYLVIPYGKEKHPSNVNRPSDLRSVVEWRSSPTRERCTLLYRARAVCRPHTCSIRCPVALLKTGGSSVSCNARA